MGTKNFSKAIAEAERLASSLENRYDTATAMKTQLDLPLQEKCKALSPVEPSVIFLFL